MEHTEKKVLAPPYLSWKTFTGFVKSFDQGLPPRIDRSAMSRLSGQNQNQMQNALVYLKLTKADGKPESLMEKIVESSVPEKQAEYQEHLRTMLKGAYPFLFDGTGDFVLERSTSAQLDERFRAVGVSGDTVMKCEAFFIAAAQEAGVKLSNLILDAKKKGRKTGSVVTPRRQPSGKQRDNHIEEETPPPYIPPAQELPIWYTTYKPAFDLLPKFATNPKPKWTTGEKENFLNLVAALTTAYIELDDKKKV